MAEQLSEVDNVANSLEEIHEDITVPRNVRTKIESIVNTLKDSIEVSIKVNKALNDLDEIVNDVNLQPYTRTQLWNVMSVLEKLNHAK
ncbi:UPF0147 family protein [Candidatus Woesearchaeota archaeon]|nr:UPF0147 family protein [Candidatus Woesearchaeota archaeon]